VTQVSGVGCRSPLSIQCKPDTPRTSQKARSGVGCRSLVLIQCKPDTPRTIQKARYASTRLYVSPQHRNPPPCLGRTPALSHTEWLRTSPHHPGGVRRCQVSLGIGPFLTAKEGSDANTHPSAPDCPHLRDRLRR
jgi:hypothetical protein